MTDLSAPAQPVERRKWRISRRGFLIGAGAAGAGLLLGIRFGWPEVQLKIAEIADGAGVPFGGVSRDPLAWFQVSPSGDVRLLLTKVEMGQGVQTALAQIAAEELGIPPADLEVRFATTRQGFVDIAGTAGSSSISSLYQPLREAAAALREMLRAEAARVLNLPAEQLVVQNKAFVSKEDPKRRVEFGALAQRRSDWEAPANPPALKSRDAWQYIAQPVQRLDIPDKVTGKAIYGYDMRLDGMLYGAVLRPPTLEAKLISARPGAAESMAGVRRVVIDLPNQFVGVVATSRAAARSALAALDVTWDAGKRWQQEELDRLITTPQSDAGGVTIQRVGDAAGQMRQGATLTAEYRTPFAVQTPLEAQAALADVRADQATVWVSTQSQFVTRRAVAQALGLNEDQVEIAPTLLGGGFGRKSGFNEVAVEAARLSQAAGAPVHLAWTREEELQNGFLRPPTHHRLAARLEQGQVAAMEHHQVSGDVLFSFFPAIAKTALGADFGATRGATIRYNIPHRRVVAHRRDLPVRTGPWRGLGLLANTFAVESFMDEIAVALGRDPLDLRLSLLPENDWGRRMAAVLRAAAGRAGWGRPAPQGRARGIACSSDVDTVVAQVAEVSLDQAAGRLRVHRITLAMDCGQAINPDGIRAQAEGGVMWGVGSALIEEARVENGSLRARNFDAYPLLTIKEAPAVDVILLDTLADGRPRGVGEPPMGPTAAAIANAFFQLTGKRLRQIPFTPERVRAALAG